MRIINRIMGNSKIRKNINTRFNPFNVIIDLEKKKYSFALPWFSDADIFWDPYQGNDSNDGRSKSRPIKTHVRLYDILQNWSSNTVRVSMRPGWYVFYQDYRPDHHRMLICWYKTNTVIELYFNNSVIGVYPEGNVPHLIDIFQSYTYQKLYCNDLIMFGDPYYRLFQTGTKFPVYAERGEKDLQYNTIRNSEIHLRNVKYWGDHAGYSNGNQGLHLYFEGNNVFETSSYLIYSNYGGVVHVPEGSSTTYTGDFEKIFHDGWDISYEGGQLIKLKRRALSQDEFKETYIKPLHGDSPLYEMVLPR